MKLLTSANGRFCVCTVPSLRLSRRAHFSAPPLLLLHRSHSYWPQPQSTVGRPGTEKNKETAGWTTVESVFKGRNQVPVPSNLWMNACHQMRELWQSHSDILSFFRVFFIGSSVSILSGGLTFPTDPFPDARPSPFLWILIISPIHPCLIVPSTL